LKKNNSIIKRTGIVLLFILIFNNLNLSYKVMKENSTKIIVEDITYKSYNDWEDDVERYALMHMNEKLKGIVYSTKVGEMVDGTTIVEFIDEKGEMEAKIALMQKKNKEWKVLWESVNNNVSKDKI